jgi:hypothetical protein
VAGKTFQMRPNRENAEAHQLQTPFSAGLPVAMFDCSVRVYRPGIHVSVFWSAMTPAANDIAAFE